MFRKCVKVLSFTLVLVMIFGLLGCTPAPASDDTTSQPPATSSDAVESPSAETAEPVTIKVFSNLPDRENGQGKLEQMLFDQYMAENPNVTIEVEALQDEPYKQKFKAYTASNSLPDLVSVWGQPAFIDPVINSGYLLELNPEDYKDYNFFEGSLNGFSKDGKLYGLPRNTDMMVFYYNKAIFEKYNISIPQTWEDLLAIPDKLAGSNIAACSMTGKDMWPLAIMFTDIVNKYTGDNTLITQAIADADFSDPKLLEAAQKMQELIDADFFQDSFTAAGYDEARNVFAQGLTATYYMGSWEMSLVNNESYDAEFRSNLGVFELPSPGGTGKITNIPAWNGGGHAIAASTKIKDEVVKLLNFMYKPENWAKNAYQLGICFPAQNFKEYMTGTESELQKTLIEFLDTSTSLSGTPMNDCGTASFKEQSENISQQFAAGMLDAQGFIQALTDAAKATKSEA